MPACARAVFTLLALVPLAPGQQSDQSQGARPTIRQGDTQPANSEGQTALPPDEDKAAAPKEYAFNPIQSNKEVQVGDYYFKKGDYRAAASRFREATKWNDGNAEAWLRLGETEEKNKEAKSAHQAYEKFLQLAPNDKKAADVKKRLEKIKG